jgi:hypothetical protein
MAIYACEECYKKWPVLEDDNYTARRSKEANPSGLMAHANCEICGKYGAVFANTLIRRYFGEDSKFNETIESQLKRYTELHKNKQLFTEEGYKLLKERGRKFEVRK